MFPLRDSTPSGTTPFVTLSLIILNGVVFFFELSMGPYVDQFVRLYGVTPYNVIHFTSHSGGFLGNVLIPLFTSVFIHGGWLHLIGNMWFLWIFGDNIEDRLGHFRYLVFYLLCGVGATLLHVMLHPSSHLPTIGASGAIAGVLGAYLLSYPNARVDTLLILVVFIKIVKLPAFIFLLIWFGLQLISGTSELSAPTAADAAGTAYWAHLGGFVAGVALILLMPKNPNRTVPAWYEGNRNLAA